MSNSLMGNMLTEHTMEKVAKDKIIMQQKQQQKQEKAILKAQMERDRENDFDPDFDDEDLKKIMLKMKDERLSQLGSIEQKQNANVGKGQYREIVEEEFLKSVTSNIFAVVHFYHNDFERCKIVDMHLRSIAEKHTECKFFYLNAEKSPFFVNKLAIQMLPTICIFLNGILKDRIVGFEEFGGRDDFKTIMLTRRLVYSKVIKAKTKAERGFSLKTNNNNDDDEDDGGSDLEQEEDRMD